MTASETKISNLERIESTPEFEKLTRTLLDRGRVRAGGLWGSSQALAFAALNRHAQGPWLVLVSSEDEAQNFKNDLELFGTEGTVFPARETAARAGGGAAAVDPESLRSRLQVAAAISGPPTLRPRIVISSVLSMLQPVPDPTAFEREVLHLKEGMRLDPDQLLKRLIGLGYTREPLAESPGEVSLRGDILDFFPFAADAPIRLESFEEELESIRLFEPADQRSIEKLETLDVSLATDVGGIQDGTGVQATSLLSKTTTVVAIEPLRIDDRAQGLRIQSASHARSLLALQKAVEERPHVELQSLPAPDVMFETRSVQALEVGMAEAVPALIELIEDGQNVTVYCQSEGERARFDTRLTETGAAHERLETCVGALSKGFRLPKSDLVCVHHRELVGILGKRGVLKARSSHKTKVLQSFFELKLGDYVVHAVHGLSRFEGLKRMKRGEGEEEHLQLVFADEVSLYVPASRIDLVQRYIGSGGASPKLDKIGSHSFRRRKEKVQQALFDLAGDLLEVQAKRAVRKRDPWEGDPELNRAMIAAFPYEDTPDQAKTDEEVEGNLSSDLPMDRLLCGDVGFGKTELAVRAAFRVVNGGGQVAVLVPTTVLAQQHYRTFSERLADFPVEVGVLSRYVSAKDVKATREKMKKGEIDIVIGTHRMLSKDIDFDRLGLLVIDEEQRFGVKHKEHFKKLRSSVDVLALSATPIPRTLHMSLSGIRDISALTTPPSGRQDVETILGYREDDDALREAILLEKNRGGQVFFLHNRVQSIDSVAVRLQKLIPECTYAIGHGQMGAMQLKRVMDAFTKGEVDVLVATTIVENGIDIPTANTIVIDEADHFGLSELHQLRGRVGRGSHKAFCYLLVDKFKPLKAVAKDRLKALEEMNHLGAGFQISVKDLEIRGAGNILGPQQSGHIGAVGYDMYCRLLKLTVERLKAGETMDEVKSDPGLPRGVEMELGLRAYLPDDWISAQEKRIEILRELDQIHAPGDEEAALEALRDRFGRLPEEVVNLVRTFRMKAQLADRGVTRLGLRDDFYLVEYDDRLALETWLAPHDVDLRPIRTGLANLHLPDGVRGAEPAADWLDAMLAVVR